MIKQILAFQIFIFIFLPMTSHAVKEKKNVLYFNSYHNGYQWSDEILEGIRTVLAKSSYKVDLQIEYMDSKKYNYYEINSSLFELYEEKFSEEVFDIIIVSDNHAYDFVVDYRDELFPGIPIVFCGINNFESTDISSGNLTGIVENFDLISTLKIARKLHPEKKRMVVVGDQSITGRSIEKQVYTMLEGYHEELEVEFWFKLSLAETQQKVEQLPNDTFLFFAPWYQTVKGKFYTAEEVIEALYTHSSVPIYTTWEFLLGHGAVGGRLLSGLHHGNMAANMALRILGGENIANIPIIEEAAGDYKFDYNVMKKLKIDQDMLPDGSEIINSPKAFYELPKEIVWTIMGSFLLVVIAVVFLVITLIERRKSQRKVMEQLSFQETLMDTIPQLVSWKDVSGKYLGANRTFSDFFGIGTIENMIHKDTEHVIDDRDYARWSVEADTAVVNRQEEFRKMRKKLINHSGNAAWLEVNKVPLRNQSGRVIGILTTAENVTKEQNLEKQLLQSQKMEAIGTLAGGIAHDFNNILTSIINSTELALGDIDPTSQTAEDLRRVLKAARRGGSVVRQILSFSKPSKEGFRPTDLAVVIHEVLGLVKSSLPSNIKVKSKITSSGTTVDADPSQVHQVILNLCTNSFHALQKEGGLLQVYVDEAWLDNDFSAVLNVLPGKYIKISIEDNGQGIEPEIIDNIFDPFFSTKDITEGTGLGLSVVHGIVKGHRGGIRVNSILGKGTRFEIFLPQAEELYLETKKQRSPGGLESLMILFVEDDDDQLNSVPRILRLLGHKVTAVNDPLAAIKLVEDEAQKFDIIISDYDLPTMRGTLLAEALPDFPFILVSGREDTLIAALPYENICKVLIKPYDKTDLEHALNAHFHKER